MSARLLAAFALALVIPAPARPAPLPKNPARGMPHLVVQIKSADGILGDLKHFRGKLADLPDQKMIPDVEFVEMILGAIMPDWRAAFETSKPFGFYMTIAPDLEKSRPVLLLPVKDEQTSLKTLGKIFEGAEEDKEGGIYHGRFSFIFSKIDTYFRFRNGHAYITFDTPDLIRDAAKLPDPADLLLKDETALIAARLYIEGVPEEAKAAARKFLDEIGAAQNIGFSGMLVTAMVGASDAKDFATRLRRCVDEAKWASLRLEYDRKTDELSLEFNLVPVKDSPLAKEIATFKPRPSRMAGLLAKETAAGLLLSYGNFGGLKLEPAAVAEVLENLLGDVGLDAGADARQALAKALIESIKVNEADVAVALKQAPGARTYTAVLGAKLQKTPQLALAVLAYVQALPKEKRERFIRAAVKIDGMEVHKLAFPDFKVDAKQLFGEGDLYFCMKDGFLFAALGTGAVDRIKECLKLEPKDGPQFLIETHPVALKRFLDVTANDQIVGEWKKVFPKEAKVRVLDGRVEGGAVLRVRYGCDILSVTKMILLGSR
jgi:hypothetical protein